MNLTAKQQLRRNVANDIYSTPVKTHSVPATLNEDGTINVPVQPVYLVDPTIEPVAPTKQVFIGNPANPASNVGTSTLYGPYGVSFQGLATDAALNSAAVSVLYNPAAVASIAGEWERTPTIFRHALCTTVAATAVWDPAAGKKFRIMGYVIIPAAGMAAAGIQLITLLDQAAAIVIAHQVYLPIAASVTNQPPIVVQLPGNGYLSVAADNILNCTLTSACTAGAISIFVYGTEE